MNKKVFLAVDLGAESGRVMAGVYDGARLALREMARFPTGGIFLPDGWHWDLARIYGDIRQGLTKAQTEFGASVVSVAVDTWGVDYGLLDENGSLLGLPWMYRDGRADGIMESVEQVLPRETLYERTGIQRMFFNTLYQLCAEARQRPQTLAAAKHLAFIPDLLTYWLGGELGVERTIASTSQLLRVGTPQWDREMAAQLGIPVEIFPAVSEPCTIAGYLREEDGTASTIKVVRCGSHDTASAVAGVPAEGVEPLFLSSGTWSLIGRELKQPRITQETCLAGFSNEQGLEGTTRFLKNVAGMWLLQECKRHWEREGETLDYAGLVAKAAGTEGGALLDPDAPEFSRPCAMPQVIASWLERHGQIVPTSLGGMTRLIIESLALKYRTCLFQMKSWMPDFPDTLHIVGGGSRNALLNQMTADATGLRVLAGPSEATAAGNIAAQMIACGEISSLGEARRIIKNSFEIAEFFPQDRAPWDEKAARFEKLLAQP